MSKRDFEAIALVIASTKGSQDADAVREHIAFWIARHAQDSNPNFDPTRFFDACHVNGHGA